MDFRKITKTNRNNKKILCISQIYIIYVYVYVYVHVYTYTCIYVHVYVYEGLYNIFSVRYPWYSAGFQLVLKSTYVPWSSGSHVWFPRPAATEPPEILLEMQSLGLHPRPMNQTFWDGGPHLCPGDSDAQIWESALEAWEGVRCENSFEKQVQLLLKRCENHWPLIVWLKYCSIKM